ncbi:hypothetical protein Taro_037833 [Colocasia esculenta]|uniref:WAT1-related protein n=1 Tax=Colocasia esculenta TaxID=4460 RepID=A0A843W549_COLES|nr:hypothetical protein [Colocasia esculenta]
MQFCLCLVIPTTYIYIYDVQGVVGSGVTVWVQAWCISRRGPLFSAMFNPLCTVITTISAFILLHEELHIGREIVSQTDDSCWFTSKRTYLAAKTL